MRNLLLLSTLLAAGLLSAPAAATGPAPVHDLDVELWAENDRDFFHPGDRLRLRLRTSRSAYVAVVHLSTDGEVEFLYPRSPWDDGRVRGRQSYSLPAGAGYAYSSYSSWAVRGSPGMGYVYAIASEEPLDFRAFRDSYGHGWGFRTLGRFVHGDPYYALDRITEELIPDWRYAEYSVDYLTYHVGRRHTYPRYACYDGYGYDRYGSRGWGEYYHSCNRLIVLLRDHPHYYDTRHRRGYRGRYLVDTRDARVVQPRHRYKEPSAADGGGAPPLRSDARQGGADEAPPARPGVRVRPEPERRPVPAQRVERHAPPAWEEFRVQQQGPKKKGEKSRPSEPERARPTLQRRPPEERSRGKERPRANPPAARDTRREPPREEARPAPPPRESSSRPSEESSPRARPPEGEP